MKARIALSYQNRRAAKGVSEAVSPDNIRTPRNLSVETVSIGSRVETLVEYHGNNLMTFLSTIDDILSCVSVAEKAFLAMDDLTEART